MAKESNKGSSIGTKDKRFDIGKYKETWDMNDNSENQPIPDTKPLKQSGNK